MKIKQIQNKIKYAMIVNKCAMIVETMIDDIFGVLYVNAMNKSVFVFSDF